MDGNRIVEENNGEKDEGGRGGRGGWGREDGGAEKDGEGVLSLPSLIIVHNPSSRKINFLTGGPRQSSFLYLQQECATSV